MTSRSLPTALLCLLVAVVLGGCGSDAKSTPTTDAGTDAAVYFDAQVSADAAANDAATTSDSATTVDSASSVDTNTVTDAGEDPDAGAADTSSTDAGSTDAGSTDAGTVDANAAETDAATPDVTSSSSSDTSSGDTSSGDTSSGDTSSGDTTTSADATASPSGTVQRLLDTPADAITSYLLAGFGSAWNLFHGAFVPIGRHSDTAHVSYHTALRFRGLPIPAGSEITSAKLSWHPTNEVDSSHALWINVYAEKAGNSAPFDAKNPAPTKPGEGRPDQRAKTKAYIDHWLVRCNSSCTDLTEYDCKQRKLDCWNRKVRFTCPKDLKSLAQEVIAQPGWKVGNDMTFFLVNSAMKKDGAKYESSRSLTGFDTARGPGFSPRLDISWKAKTP